MRLTPLPADANQDLQDSFKRYRELLGYVLSSVLIMQRKPVEFGEKHLKGHGWRVGKHRP